MSALISGLIGGAIAGGLGALALRTQSDARITREGWKRLRPNWLMHFALVGCFAFVGAMGYFFWLGGSARADADKQNLWALLLLLAFAAGGIWTLFAAYLRRVEWVRGTIRVRMPWVPDRHYAFDDIVEVAPNIDGSQFKLIMRGGEIVRLNTYAHGFKELLMAIGNHLQRRDAARR